MARYVALLRGINVGGNNLIRMPDLKACFERQGFQDVVTYIQSGNVLFTSAESGSDRLTRRIEVALASAFGRQASVFLRTARQMQSIVGRAPDGFGAHPERYRYDIIFLKPPVTAAAAMKSVTTREGVDRAALSTCSTFSRPCCLTFPQPDQHALPNVHCDDHAGWIRILGNTTT